MDKQASVKKIQKVQRAGVSRVAGQRRAMGFPLAIAMIVIVGSFLTYLARESYRGTAGDAPALNDESGKGDYYYVAYGVFICGKFITPLSDANADSNGIDSFADGLIHIRPSVEDAAGKGAVLSKWASNIGLKISDTSFELPANAEEETKKYSNGDSCTIDKKKVKSKVALFVWPPQAGSTTKAEKVTSDIGDASLREDRSALVLAFVPEKWDACSNIAKPDDKSDPKDCVPLPASMDNLKKPEPIYATTTTAPPASESGSSGASGSSGQSGASGASTPAADGSTTTPSSTAPSTTAPSSTAPSSTAPSTTAGSSTTVAASVTTSN